MWNRIRGPRRVWRTATGTLGQRAALRWFCVIVFGTLLTPAAAFAGLFVASAGNTQIYEFGSDGAFVKNFSAVGGSVFGIVTASDGTIFTVSSGNAWIGKYPAGGGPGSVIASTFFQGTGMPFGIIIGPGGDLFTTEDSDVGRYDATTGVFKGAVVASGSGGLSFPTGLAFGPNGDLFVSSDGTNQVLEYDGQTGAFLRVFAEGGGLSGPMGIVFGPNNDLFVDSVLTNNVLRYDGQTGAFKGVFAQGGGLVHPYGLAFEGGDLFVPSNGTNQVLRYNGSTGAFEGVFAEGNGLDGPTGLAFTSIPEPSSFMLGLAAASLAAAAHFRRRLSRRRSE